jgi:Domain of unknown function (DUF4249)
MKKLLFLCCLIISSCIDRINIEIPDSYTSQLVVDGLITDEPGPYTVLLTKTAKIEKFYLRYREVVAKAKITISDDIGTSEVLNETEPGTYQTPENGIRGTVGRTYSIKIETKDGTIYESIPDKMNPVGELDSLYYEFESFLPLADQTRYGFRFYIDAKASQNTDNLVRWKFIGIAEIDTYPQLHTKACPGGGPPCCPDPRPCSGFKLNDFGNPISIGGNCTCCTCWVTSPEEKPHVSDNQFVTNGKAKKIEVGYVPLEYFPFQKGKYRAEVKQMSLSRVAFDYWRIIQSQKEGATSLFQPPTGKIKGNIIEKNGVQQPVGIFYASSVKKKQHYLTYGDIKAKFSRTPLWVCEVGRIAESCILAFPNSSNKPPADWK